MSHTGPARVRFADDRFTVLCPLGHIVTGGATGPKSGFPGSFMESKITAHQSGLEQWTVECDGAEPKEQSKLKTPEQIAEEIMSGWTWDGMPSDQLNAVRYFAIAAIKADRAQREATLSYFVIATQGSRSVEAIVGRYSTKLEADAVADAWKDVNGQYGIRYRVEEDYS